MADFPESDKPNITSREHFRRQERLARHQIRLRGTRTIILTVMALALFAYVFAAPYTAWVLAGTVAALITTLIVERHLVHRYLIETLAEEIVYLAIVADPGHCATTYAKKLTTIPAHEVHAAIVRLAHAHRIGAEREHRGGHDITTWRPDRG